MAVVRVSYFTDPACPRSWAVEPWRRRLQSEFGDDLRFTYVMTGLARTIDRPLEQMRDWLDAAATSGMPVDPRLWLEAPPASTYPACMAVKAADEQGRTEPYLRALREGFGLRRRKLDTLDALVGLARSVPGVDVDRFRVDLGSHAIVEAFGADIDRATAAAGSAAALAGEAGGAEGTRVATPWLELRGDDGVVHGAGLQVGLDGWRAAAIAAGATPSGEPAPTVEEALRRLGSLATPEVAAVCGLPGPRATAELWELAVEWRVRSEAVLGGAMWSLA
jgi:predicted DsbA family dithiol-disulfide isomerase